MLRLVRIDAFRQFLRSVEAPVPGMINGLDFTIGTENMENTAFFSVASVRSVCSVPKLSIYTIATHLRSLRRAFDLLIARPISQKLRQPSGPQLPNLVGKAFDKAAIMRNSHHRTSKVE